jgi:hypothetical protein
MAFWEDVMLMLVVRSSSKQHSLMILNFYIDEKGARFFSSTPLEKTCFKSTKSALALVTGAVTSKMLHFQVVACSLARQVYSCRNNHERDGKR